MESMYDDFDLDIQKMSIEVQGIEPRTGPTTVPIIIARTLARSCFDCQPVTSGPPTNCLP